MMVLAILLFISLVFNGIVNKIYRPKTSKENPENESTEGQNSQGFNEHSANADQNHDYEVIEDPERRIQLSKSLGTKELITIHIVI